MNQDQKEKKRITPEIRYRVRGRDTGWVGYVLLWEGNLTYTSGSLCKKVNGFPTFWAGDGEINVTRLQKANS